MKRIITLAAAIVLLAPRFAGATDIYVQAESFTRSHNIMPEDIRAYGGALLGLDYPGEWAEFQVSASKFGTYLFSMRCWGNKNAPYFFHLIMKPVKGDPPTVQVINVSFTGRGYCGS